MSAALDLVTLDIFRVVAAERSVTRAAQRLERVQSNVTTRIQQLEEELATPLFLREGKRMLLTPAGERLLGYAEQLLALSEEARQAMRPELPAGRLRVGTMESTAASRLPRWLAQYHQRWPEVDLALSTGTTAGLIEAVLARGIDCALVADPDAVRGAQGTDATLAAQLDAVPVFTEQLMLVLPASHPAVAAAQAARRVTLAGFAQGCAYRQIGENWLHEASAGGGAVAGAAGADGAGAGAVPHVKVLELGSYHAILACVAAGACMAVMPQSVLDLQPDLTPFKTYPLMQVDTLLVSRKGYATAAFSAFAAVLAQASAACGTAASAVTAARPAAHPRPADSASGSPPGVTSAARTPASSQARSARHSRLLPK